MGKSREKTLRNHRRRLKERGIKRVEVEAAETDAALIRQLAKVLRAGGEKAEDVRLQLAELVAPDGPGLKALLASAPLEGIRIIRSRDPGRSLDL